MSRRRTSKKKQDETLVDLVEAREHAQDFFERHQNLIVGVVAAIVLVAIGVFAYFNFYKAPRELEASEQMYQAQFQFERDSFALALSNPGGGFDGFLDIIDNYNGTKAANLAKYYSGVCYLNLGQYDIAIEYFESFKPKDEVTAVMKQGALGDCYSSLGDMDKALDLYSKAANMEDNDLLTPYYLKKSAMLLEKQGDHAAALELYKRIKDEYPDSPDGRVIQKYIVRAEAKVQ